MHRLANRGHTTPCAWPTLVALLALLLSGPPVRATDPIRAGYTRPGAPSDRRVGGKVVPALDNPQGQKNAFGGTVYYMVLERTGRADNPWGVTLKDFDNRFRPGIDFSGSSSPALDNAAKYLYLYQVVNDRRTPVPIESAAVEILVDFKDITSWGHFHGVGFATPMRGEPEKRGAIRPVSVANVVGGAVEHLYRRQAPAVPTKAPFRLVRVPTLRGEKAPVETDQKKVVDVLWDPLDPAHDPNHVMLLAGSELQQRPSFRAIWSGKDVLAKEVRSTVFGFTSNLPPTLEPVRLRALRLDAKGKPIRLAVAADGVPAEARGAQIVADGRVPSPRPESKSSQNTPSVMPPLPSSPGGGMPGGAVPALASGGGGFPGAAPVGGIGSSVVPFLGGGGGGGQGGGSSGLGFVAAATGSNTQTQGNQQPNQNQNQNLNQNQNQQTQNQQQNQNQQPSQNQSIVISPVFLNQNLQSQQQQQAQQQQQSQQQQQNQQQGQQQTQDCPCAAVPEPAALLLAALAIPFLLLRCRRTNTAVSAPSA